MEDKQLSNCVLGISTEILYDAYHLLTALS